MYTTVRGVPSDEDVAGAVPGVKRRRVSRVVVTLGAVSFFTDLSSEMVVAVLPVYLTLVLGLTPFQYGIIDGVYQGVTAAVRIAGGIAADLTRRPKVVAVLGYGISCVAKLLFLPAQTFGAVTGLVALDRSGKGLRTAPRDAMIVEASEPGSLGHSFGVHRAMDTAGALGGPLIAVGVLSWLVDGYDALFVLSFSLAAIGVAILVLFVPAQTQPEGASSGVSGSGPVASGSPDPGTGRRRKGALRRTVREFGGLARGSAYRRLLAVGALLSLTTISDGFVYLALRDRVSIGAALFPLLFVGTAGVYLLLAIPLGRLADRIGRVRVFLAGHFVAALGYAALWLLALVGVYYAATDGVLPALTAPIVPEAVRTSGIAGVQTVMAVGSMASAGLFGLVWSRSSQSTAVATFAAALLVAVLVAAWLMRGTDTRPERPHASAA
jgi:hypothetical protein